MARRFLDFLAGAAVGAAVVAYLKSDRERLISILDKAEAALSGGEDSRLAEESPVNSQEENND